MEFRAIIKVAELHEETADIAVDVIEDDELFEYIGSVRYRKATARAMAAPVVKLKHATFELMSIGVVKPSMEELRGKTVRVIVEDE